MTKVFTADYIVPSAWMGEENPLPFYRDAKNNSDYKPDENNVPSGYDRIGFGWETGVRVLPYRMQDNYSRERQDKAWFSIVLENEYLKAIIVPGMGGKLVSLFDKIHNKELFVCNPVFQPGNLALRNAWTSGGIEYNFGQLGHHYQTCEPLHASLIDTELGKVVRIFTWDRIKMCSYHYDFCLPDNSPYLYTYVRLINPNHKEIPVYWWTNIAVPVFKGGRVIAPAEKGYLNTTVYTIKENWKGQDVTHADSMNHSYDIFFRIPKGTKRPWEISVDKDGNGFIIASTDRLIGRKLFSWGEGKGGRHWNEYLSTAETPTYLEVQAGLAYTQMHSVPMPADTEWDWVEMYGAYEGSSEVVNAKWEDACEISQKRVDELIPESLVYDYYEKMKLNKNKSGEVVFVGQGWGALENYRAKITGDKSYIPCDFAFSESDMTQKQALWKEFLETGVMKEPKSVTDYPGEYMIQEEWFDLLKKSLEKDNNWFVNFLIGVCYMERLNYVNAKAYFDMSVDLKPNPWAYYSLAIIASKSNNMDLCCENYEKAIKLFPTNPQLVHEYLKVLYDLGKYNRMDEILSYITPQMIEFERIKLDIIKNALKKNDFATIDKYADYDFATNREGEILLSQVWFEMMARKKAIKDGVEFKDSMVEEYIKLHDDGKTEEKLPGKFDFRMSGSNDFYVPPTER